MNKEIKKYILDHMDLINQDTKESWEKFYDFNALSNDKLFSQMNKILLDSGINPLLKLDRIPAGFFFSWVGGLDEYEIPNNIKIIGSCAFQSSGLKKIRIPKSVVKIETYAFFDGYPNLKVIYEGSIEDWNNIEKEMIGVNDSQVQCLFL